MNKKSIKIFNLIMHNTPDKNDSEMNINMQAKT